MLLLPLAALLWMAYPHWTSAHITKNFASAGRLIPLSKGSLSLSHSLSLTLTKTASPLVANWTNEVSPFWSRQACSTCTCSGLYIETYRERCILREEKKRRETIEDRQMDRDIYIHAYISLYKKTIQTGVSLWYHPNSGIRRTRSDRRIMAQLYPLCISIIPSVTLFPTLYSHFYSLCDKCLPVIHADDSWTVYIHLCVPQHPPSLQCSTVISRNH